MEIDGKNNVWLYGSGLRVSEFKNNHFVTYEGDDSYLNANSLIFNGNRLLLSYDFLYYDPYDTTKSYVAAFTKTGWKKFDFDRNDVAYHVKLVQDIKGQIWGATSNGLLALSNDRFLFLRLDNAHFGNLWIDRKNRLWLNNQGYIIVGKAQLK
jgi:ligand-binding sensor domain-containing protein